jgi:hypothetical protein
MVGKGEHEERDCKLPSDESLEPLESKTTPAKRGRFRIDGHNSKMSYRIRARIFRSLTMCAGNPKSSLRTPLPRPQTTQILCCTLSLTTQSYQIAKQQNMTPNLGQRLCRSPTQTKNSCSGGTIAFVMRLWRSLQVLAPRLGLVGAPLI